jgi:hypothetical protein
MLETATRVKANSWAVLFMAGTVGDQHCPRLAATLPR